MRGLEFKSEGLTYFAHSLILHPNLVSLNRIKTQMLETDHDITVNFLFAESRINCLQINAFLVKPSDEPKADCP